MKQYNKQKICHFTSVHGRYDIRIFHKECVSLSKKYDVMLIVADGKGNEVKDGINIIDVGIDNSRLARIKKTPKRIYKILKDSDYSVYHFHDPELLPIAKKLIKRGKKVVYDVHEDVPRQILAKYWIPKFLRKLTSYIFEKYENKIARNLSYIVTATPFIRDRFLKNNPNTIDINNFPIINEFKTINTSTEKEKAICYIGGITKIRGIKNIVKAIDNCDCILYLAGEFDNDGLKEELKELAGWNQVKELGWINRDEVKLIAEKSVAGLVTFLPVPNHLDALPNKLFEYMSAGLPVIASDFKLWREIIEKHNCGICVDPENINEISNAINKLLDDKEMARILGENGRKAVETVYNWNIEENKLYMCYNVILS
ncbi:MAG: glycosyltransferase family 4 protein [Marinilabiliales bacterium]